MRISRVERYKVYRSEIEHMTVDSPLLKKTKEDERVKPSKKQGGVTKTTLDIPMEELLSAHAKLVGKEKIEQQRKLEQKKKKIRLFGYLAVSMVVLIVIILVLCMVL